MQLLHLVCAGQKFLLRIYGRNYCFTLLTISDNRTRAHRLINTSTPPAVSSFSVVEHLSACAEPRQTSNHSSHPPSLSLCTVTKFTSLSSFLRPFESLFHFHGCTRTWLGTKPILVTVEFCDFSTSGHPGSHSPFYSLKLPPWSPSDVTKQLC